MISTKRIHIVGGGLAGSEAAWQALQAGASVVLHEMRPKQQTPAHRTGDLAELVCSNSLKSLDPYSVPGMLKKEMASFESLVVSAAYEAQVPAGAALAVDRAVFSQEISDRLNAHPNFQRVDEEVTEIPSEEELANKDECMVIASGPLTSSALAEEIKKLCGGDERLYFYDAIAPVLAADSLDWDHCFRADRYGKGDGDYVNLPLDKVQYEAFLADVREAEKVPLHSFEKVDYFESCLPIEVMVDRGPETLRFGPLKPVGLIDPKTGKQPYACIQLRMENKAGSMYSMVGFQTKMKWPEQKRVFSKIPAFREVEFLRFGSVHRNTYVQSPKVLNPDLSFRNNNRVFLAGQITGVEGYTESAAMGLIAGRSGASKLGLGAFPLPPETSVMGALLQYVCFGCKGKFAPMNANFGLLPTVQKVRGMSKKDKKKMQSINCQEAFAAYFNGAQFGSLEIANPEGLQ